MSIVFAWDDWNKQHVTKHGLDEATAEFIVRHAEAPFPREIGEDKYLIWGQTFQGALAQVIFAFRLPDELEFTNLQMLDWSAMIDYRSTVAVYVIHAMPLTARQIKQYRKLWSDR